MEKLWFSQSIEGLFIRGVGEAMTPALRAQLLGLGIDLERLKPAYPNDAVVSSIRLSGEALFPGKPEPEALREMGKLFMKGFAETLIGRAMVQFMRVIGPRRSLQRMERNFRTGGNYIETRFTSLGERKAQVWFNDVSGIPDFYAGIIERGGQFAGARALQVTFDAGTSAFDVNWTE
jgi:uncharacterized protein (TIGR02265 family)